MSERFPLRPGSAWTEDWKCGKRDDFRIVEVVSAMQTCDAESEGQDQAREPPTCWKGGGQNGEKRSLELKCRSRI